MKKPSSTSSASKPANNVLACGTFDLLHPGHLAYLESAAALGLLHVLIARDTSVLKIKHRTPIHDEQKRLANVRALPFVNAAFLGDAADFHAVFSKLHVDILALGYDQVLPFHENTLPPHVRIVRLAPFEPERHKTSLLRKDF